MVPGMPSRGGPDRSTPRFYCSFYCAARYEGSRDDTGGVRWTPRSQRGGTIRDGLVRAGRAI